ncbi:MAG TPA: DUF397 domain-containing protein [Micromonosporaceae bacterium]|nr:DUF397 domain-containing protein [Micromonosporaceae bacterium]
MNTSDLSRATWTKTTRSSGTGQCVEVARVGDAIAVRDSKNPAGPRLTFTAGAWAEFVRAVKAGHADLPD